MKQNKTKLLAATAILAVFTAIFLSCTSGKTETLDLRYGFTTEPTTLDPLNRNNTADGRIILFNVFEGLVKPNTDGTFMPCIAESWTVSPDSLVYSFTLREGIRFHDGSIVTAKDVKFSLDTAKDNGFNGLDTINEVIIQGENQINVVLNNPDPDFLPFLTVGIVKAENTDRESSVIGTGPFYIESYITQRHLVLKRFDDYWQRFLSPPHEIPYLEKVTIVFFANYEAMMTSLRSGNIDGASLTGSDIAQLDKNNFDFVHNYSSAVQLLALNNAHTPLDDIRVRKAINYGIDVQGIIDAAFFGHGSHSGSPIIPGLSVYFESSLGYLYDPDMAKEYLAQAGFNENTKLNLEITVPSNFGMHVDTAQVIADQLEKIGIQVNIRLVDWNTWLSDVYRQRNYQATVISLDSPVVSPRRCLTRYHSTNNNNFINFVNKDYDNTFDSIMTEIDSEKRINLYKEAQKIITTNAASVFIQDIVYYMVFRKGLFGGALNYPLYIIDFSTIYRIKNN